MPPTHPRFRALESALIPVTCRGKFSRINAANSSTCSRFAKLFRKQSPIRRDGGFSSKSRIITNSDNAFGNSHASAGNNEYPLPAATRYFSVSKLVVTSRGETPPRFPHTAIA